MRTAAALLVAFALIAFGGPGGVGRRSRSAGRHGRAYRDDAVGDHVRRHPVMEQMPEFFDKAGVRVESDQRADGRSGPDDDGEQPADRRGDRARHGRGRLRTGRHRRQDLPRRVPTLALRAGRPQRARADAGRQDARRPRHHLGELANVPAAAQRRRSDSEQGLPVRAARNVRRARCGGRGRERSTGAAR